MVGENSISRNYIVMIRIGSVLAAAAALVLLYVFVIILLKRAQHNTLEKRLLFIISSSYVFLLESHREPCTHAYNIIHTRV